MATIQGLKMMFDHDEEEMDDLDAIDSKENKKYYSSSSSSQSNNFKEYTDEKGNRVIP